MAMSGRLSLRIETMGLGVRNAGHVKIGKGSGLDKGRFIFDL
jgi:hypothetical protein